MESADLDVVSRFLWSKRHCEQCDLLDVTVIVQAPIWHSDLSGAVEKPSHNVIHHNACAHGHPHSVDSFYDPVDDVWGCLKQIWIKQVQEVYHRILTAQSYYPEGHMLDDRGCSLAMDLISVDESVLKKGCHRVDVIFRHLTNVFKKERKGFEDTVLNI